MHFALLKAPEKLQKQEFHQYYYHRQLLAWHLQPE